MILGTPRTPRARASLLPAVFVAASLAFGASAASAQTVTAKMGTATINEDQHEWLKRFKDLVEKRTNGRFKAEIFPANQLGSIPRQVEGLQLGTQEVWIGPPGFMIGLDQRFQLFDSPGWFDDMDHAFRTMVHPDMREKILALGEAKGVKGMGITMTSQTSYVSRTPIKTIADFKGKKIRVLASKIERRIMEEFGASPAAMDLSEVITAISQGTVDGARSAISVWVPFKYQTVAKHLLVTHEGFIPAVAMFSKAWFDKVPADMQKIMIDTAKEIEQPVQDFGKKLKEGMYDTWVQSGGEIHRLSTDEQKEFLRRTANIGKELAAENPQVKQFYDLMIATAAKTKSKPM
ncbi:MAG: TRAP transporter substrate-binding protein [Rhodospirillales bacterium]